MKALLLTLVLFPFISYAQDFPSDWWREVPRSEAASWEILPQDAKEGEVILSKRTLLGVFSNFAATPFVLDGIQFASIEGLWQSLKYPDPDVASDPRHQMQGWSFTRAEVQSMVAFEAKSAGDLANKIYEKYKYKNISWGEAFFNYKDHAQGSDFHLAIIKRATRAKLDAIPGLWELLLKTHCLRLRPDHRSDESETPAYRYYDIYMSLRSERQFVSCQNKRK